MNYYLIIANILTFLSFIIHTLEGDRDLKFLLPKKENEEKQTKWTQARAGWHWVSVDLLLVSILLASVNFTHLVDGHERFVLQLVAICFYAYATSWILVIFVSKSFERNYLKLGQWGLLLLIGMLIQLGLNGIGV